MFCYVLAYAQWTIGLRSLCLYWKSCVERYALLEGSNNCCELDIATRALMRIDIIFASQPTVKTS